MLLSILGNSDGVLSSNPCQWLPGLFTSSPLNQDIICISLFLPPMVKNGFKAPSMVIVIFTQLIFNKIQDVIVSHDFFPFSFSNGNKVLGSILHGLNDLGLV